MAGLAANDFNSVFCRGRAEKKPEKSKSKMSVSIKDKISLFLNSPVEALSLVGRDLLCKIKVPAQVVKLREITRERPLFLQIETINTCNAAWFE